MTKRASVCSLDTASTTSIPTPATEKSSYSLSRSTDKRSFGGALKLLLEDDTNFRDWIEDAKKQAELSPELPTISVPDTPVANVEIRLVEPTPVPSRVGSLGATTSLQNAKASPAPPMQEAVEEIEEEPEHIVIDTKSRSKKKSGKFFVHSSPGKGSGSDASHTSPVPTGTQTGPSPTSLPKPPRKSHSPHDKVKKTRIKDVVDHDRPPRRNVSLSTMRGRFQAEKRIAAETIAAQEQAAQDEDSGWEDEVEDGENRLTATANEPQTSQQAESSGGSSRTAHVNRDQASEEAVDDDEGEWSDEPDSKPSSTQPNSVRTQAADALDLGRIVSAKVTRQNSSRKSSATHMPPPPAPTPLRNMSKKERQAAAAERARIEAELEAQRKREMFAKQQIFGRPVGTASGLSGLLNHGASMVNLVSEFCMY